MTARVVFISLGCLVLACPAAAECRLSAAAIIPLVRFDGHYIMAADINGHRANLIADTGASSINIEVGSAARLGVSLNLREKDNLGIGGSERAYRGFARTLRFSQLLLHSQFIGGTDAPVDRQIDGLFGMNVMTPYDIDLDLVGLKMILFETTGICTIPTVAMARPLYSARLATIRNDALAEVDVLINGRRIRALIDSGSPTSVLFRQAATRLGLDLAQFDGPGHRQSKGVGPRKVRSFTQTISEVSIGNLALRNVAIEVLDQPGFAAKRFQFGWRLADYDDSQAGSEQMILGADFLQKVHVWISHSSHRLVMQYPPQASAVPK